MSLIKRLKPHNWYNLEYFFSKMYACHNRDLSRVAFQNYSLSVLISFTRMISAGYIAGPQVVFFYTSMRQQKINGPNDPLHTTPTGLMCVPYATY